MSNTGQTKSISLTLVFDQLTRTRPGGSWARKGTAFRGFLDVVMSLNAKPGPQLDERASARDALERRQNLVRILFVHRALAEKTLRDQRDRAEKELRRSEARYRALAGNLSYGICRCSLDGRFLEVNDALMRMLGYESREELLALDLARDIIQEPHWRAQLLGQTSAGAFVEPIEVEWKRKDRAALKVRLSGREVVSEQGGLEAYEVIVEDVTRQRELEDHLRRQAASDSLTGLANDRRLVDVLDSEIKRSNRTNR